MTAPSNERRKTVRLVRPGDDEHAFDRDFWREIGPSGRLESLWDMVLEARTWTGQIGDQPRLQKSVLRVERP